MGDVLDMKLAVLRERYDGTPCIIEFDAVTVALQRYDDPIVKIRATLMLLKGGKAGRTTKHQLLRKQLYLDVVDAIVNAYGPPE